MDYKNYDFINNIKKKLNYKYFKYFDNKLMYEFSNINFSLLFIIIINIFFIKSKIL